MLGNSLYSGHCVKNDLQSNEGTSRKTCMETRESVTEYTTHTHTHTYTISHTHLQIIQPYRKPAYIKSKRKPWGSRNNSCSPSNWLCISSRAQILHSTCVIGVTGCLSHLFTNREGAWHRPMQPA